MEVYQRPLTCEICRHDFNQEGRSPRMLKECGHTICEKCATKLWEHGKITCPFDRRETKTRDVKSLPKNLSTVRLLNSSKRNATTVSKIHGSDVPSILSSKCSKNATHIAWFSCVECKLDYCKSCFDIMHDEYSNCHHTRTLNMEQVLQANKGTAHPAEFGEFIRQDSACQDQPKLYCVMCLLRDHKHKHHVVVSFKFVVQENLKKLQIEMMKTSKDNDYTDIYIPKRRDSFYENSIAFREKMKHITGYFDNQKKKAVEQFKKFAQERLLAGNKMVEQHEKAIAQEKTLLGIRSEIRSRLFLKRKLIHVDDIVLKHKKAFEEFNQKNDTPKINDMQTVWFDFSPAKMKIIYTGTVDDSDDISETDKDGQEMEHNTNARTFDTKEPTTSNDPSCSSSNS